MTTIADESPNTTTSTSTTKELPRSNKEYGKQSYWEERFKTEEEYEWLVSYQDIKSQIQPYVHISNKILLVGCGNSSFSADLYDDGYTNITSLDYSKNVIDAMREKHCDARPDMKWICMDMTNMDGLDDQSFDVVIDKAAMDALISNEGNVWDPDQYVIDSCRKMCQHISRILVDGGYHLHISFSQIHFRKKYLLGQHDSPSLSQSGGVSDQADDEVEELIEQKNSEDGTEYCHEFGWDLKVDTLGTGGMFDHFLYTMKKRK